MATCDLRILVKVVPVVKTGEGDRWTGRVGVKPTSEETV